MEDYVTQTQNLMIMILFLSIQLLRSPVNVPGPRWLLHTYTLSVSNWEK